MARITLNEVQPLLDQFAGPGPVLSCYADRTGAEGFRHSWEGPLAAQAEAIRKNVGEDRAAARLLETNLASVREALAAPVPDAPRWLAVFSASQRGFFHTVPLDVPVAPDLVADTSPYLVPLLAAALRYREYLAVHTDTHRGRLYAATPGAVRLLEEMDADVPRKQHSAGERWGQSQATIARHRDDAIRHYLKELVARVEHAWADGHYAGLLLLGAHPILEQVRKALPDRLAARVERETPEAWSDRPAEVTAAIRDMAARVFTQDETRALDGAWPRLAERRGAALGPREVLAAVQGGRVGPDGFGSLLVGPDAREVVGRCTRCRALALDAPPTCPRCLAPCVTGSLWEELLLMALRHRLAVQFVDDPDRLAPYGGLAAILPKAEAPVPAVPVG